MSVFRGLMLLMLLASAAAFAFYAVTGQKRWRDLGLKILRWTLAAGFVFFAVLIAERLAQ
jgi:hypothetical protein